MIGLVARVVLSQVLAVDLRRDYDMNATAYSISCWR